MQVIRKISSVTHTVARSVTECFQSSFGTSRRREVAVPPSRITLSPLRLPRACVWAFAEGLSLHRSALGWSAAEVFIVGFSLYVWRSCAGCFLCASPDYWSHTTVARSTELIVHNNLRSAPAQRDGNAAEWASVHELCHPCLVLHTISLCMAVLSSQNLAHRSQTVGCCLCRYLKNLLEKLGSLFGLTSITWSTVCIVLRSILKQIYVCIQFLNRS